MASSIDFVEYVCDQMCGAGRVTYKKMFGEYTLYCNEKVLGLICDNQVFIKPTSVGDEMLPDAERVPPYEGAKPHILLEEFEDKSFLTEFISATCEKLPQPKAKKKKKL